MEVQKSKRVIEALLRAKSLEQRKIILSNLDKEEKQALFGELYFERGTKLGISLYDRYLSKFGGFYVPYNIAYLLVKNLNHPTVLDLGCASGRFVRALKELEVESYGVDVSSYALSKSDKKTRKYLSNIDIDTEELPFPKDYFDMAVAIDVLEHLVNIKHVLDEIKRVLKPGGLLLVTCPKPNSPDAFRDITHVNIWNRDMWVKTFSESGFQLLPLDVNYREILKAHVDLLTASLDFGTRNIREIIKPLSECRLAKSVLYAYLLLRHRLRKALQILINSDYVFLLKTNN